MKFFAFVVVVTFVAQCVIAEAAPSVQSGESLEEEDADLVRERKNAPAYGIASHAPAKQIYQAAAPAYHAQAPAYHGAYAPHVPCGKQVLVGCAPSIATIPCKTPSYQSSGY